MSTTLPFSESFKWGLIRFLKVVWIPATLNVVDALNQMLQSGSFVLDYKRLGFVFLAGLVLGIGKLLREWLDVDLKVV